MIEGIVFDLNVGRVQPESTHPIRACSPATLLTSCEHAHNLRRRPSPGITRSGDSLADCFRARLIRSLSFLRNGELKGMHRRTYERLAA